jgi:hypothetical protein
MEIDPCLTGLYHSNRMQSMINGNNVTKITIKLLVGSTPEVKR